MAQASKEVKKRKKKGNVEPAGVAHIKATFNNTHITLTDKFGNTVAWSTAGTSGFKGSRKSTAFAATLAAEKAAQQAIQRGMKPPPRHVLLKPGPSQTAMNPKGSPEEPASCLL